MSRTSVFSKKEKKRRRIFTIITILVAVPLLFPIYWVVIRALQGVAAFVPRIPSFFPQKLVVETYVSQLLDPATLIALRNSCIIAVGSTAVSMILAVPCAYGLSRFRFKGKKAMLLTFLVTQMLPSSLILTPLYLIYSKVGLLNTYLAPILSTATLSIPFVVLMLRPIFSGIPAELEEAALIDGCGRFKAFTHIILPITKNGTVTGLAFSFIYAWNDLMYSITFNTQESLRPMTTRVYNFMTLYGTKWNYIMAYGVILALPVLILFIVLQKYIVQGLVSGSVKG